MSKLEVTVFLTYQSKVSCQRCSKGLSQFRLLPSVPGTSARHIKLYRQGVAGNGPKIVHGQPQCRGAHQSQRSQEIQTISCCNVDNLHGPTLTLFKDYSYLSAITSCRMLTDNNECIRVYYGEGRTLVLLNCYPFSRLEWNRRPFDTTG